MIRSLISGRTSGRPAFDQVRAIATATPNLIAIEQDRRPISYGDFVEVVDRRAAELRAAGVRPDDRVAIVADNSAAYLISAFAVWETGAVLVTVYASSGAQDLEYCLAHSAPALVLTEPEMLEVIRKAAGAGTSVYDIHASIVADTPLARSVESDPLPDGLALICYTSGSTSTPKAVMHSHDGLYMGAADFGRAWKVSSRDRTIVSLPMAWAFGLISTSMNTLLAGGTVLPFRRTKPELIVDAIASGATLFAGVTTMYAKTLSYIQSLEAHAIDFSGLRFCVSGGEPRNETAFAEWARLTGCQVHDNYATSECFPVVTSDPESAATVPPRSSGKVVPGAALKVVDPSTGLEVSHGKAGEAWVKAPATFIGYWRDEESTRKALTDDGWYKTNDLVCIDKDGFVFVEGRLTDMIIRGGANVSPLEVEDVIRSHADVIDVAVVGLPDPTHGQRVTAFIETAGGRPVDSESIIEYCKKRLAGYKVPTEVAGVTSLPRSATGKVDRKSLVASSTSD